ncbi:MAG TPA: hypothetical protein VFV05_08805 [Methylomirabilota bacterium]|nr:hypothetical protein [Methylomirabilota bacterium]
MDDTKDTADCDSCGGSGVRWADAYDRQLGRHFTDEWPCSTCDGTGQVEAEPTDDETEAA